jgi:hypothetical protein
MLPTITFQQLEAHARSANPRGLGSALGARIFKRTAHRIEEGIQAPQAIESLLPMTRDIEQPVLNGKLKTLGNVVCIESGMDYTAVNTNFLVNTQNGKILANKVMQIMDGGVLAMAPEERNPLKIQLGTTRADRSLLDWAEDLNNPNILKGVKGQNLTGDRVQQYIAKVKLPEEVVAMKRTYPRSFALLNLNKSVNLAFDGGKAIAFTKDRAVAVAELEDSLHPSKIERTIKDSKAPTKFMEL